MDLGQILIPVYDGQLGENLLEQSLVCLTVQQSQQLVSYDMVSKEYSGTLSCVGVTTSRLQISLIFNTTFFMEILRIEICTILHLVFIIKTLDLAKKCKRIG